MAPNIFISSTIFDLHYLRDALRDLIQTLGYNVIMSEYGSVGFLPHLSVEDSCYRAVSDAQLVICIVGKRYGSVPANVSVSQNEFRAAVKQKIPVITLIDSEVLTYKKVFFTNPMTTFSDMDNAKLTFEFINEIKASTVNNAYTPFSSAPQAVQIVKEQLAHIFRELLVEKYNPITSRLHDILSEIKALHYNQSKPGTSDADFNTFRKVTRLILDDQQKVLNSFLRIFFQNFDEGIISVMNFQNVQDIVGNKGWFIKIEDARDLMRLAEFRNGRSFSSLPEIVPNEITREFPDQFISFSSVRDEKTIYLNGLTERYLNHLISFVKNKASENFEMD